MLLLTLSDRAAQVELTEKEMRLIDQIEACQAISIADLSKQQEIKSVMPLVRPLCEKGVLTMQESLVGGYKAKYETYFRLTEAYRHQEALNIVLDSLSRAKKQQALLTAYLAQFPDLSSPDDILLARKPFLDATGSSLSVYNALEERGVFETVMVQKERLQQMQNKLEPLSSLSVAQQKAYDEIKQLFESKETVLLHGVTSSGKTEVYMHLIADTVAQGKQVLFLVPEIGLTTQLATRLRRVFCDKLGVYPSKFSAFERVEIWNNLFLNKE